MEQQMKGRYGQFTGQEHKSEVEACKMAIKRDGIDLIELLEMSFCRPYTNRPTVCYIPLIHYKDLKKMQKKSDSFIVKVPDGEGFIVYAFGQKMFFEAHEMDAVKEYMVGKLNSAIIDITEDTHWNVQ